MDFSDLSRQISQGTDALQSIELSRTAAQLKALVANPTANTTLTLIAVAVVSVIVLLLVVGLLIALVPSKRYRTVRIREYTVEEPEPTPAAEGADSDAGEAVEKKPSAWQTVASGTKRAIAAIPVGWVIVALAVLSFAAADAATSDNSYCLDGCHDETVNETVAKQSAVHGDCIDCHENPAVLATPTNLLSRMLMVYDTMQGGEPPTSVRVDSENCLSCHQEIAKGVRVSRTRVKMSHEEVIAQGQSCTTTCHSLAGHGTRSYVAGMSPCITCHDGVKASADCGVCHVGDPAQSWTASAEGTSTLGSGDIQYPTVTAANKDCGACHNLKKECDSCHGIRLPHTEAFRSGGHAMQSAFEGKKTCWNCHQPGECNARCHQSISNGGMSGHGGNWKSQHGVNGPRSICGCHDGRPGVDRTTSFCYVCHDSPGRQPQPDFPVPE